LRRKLGEEGRKTVETHYSLKRWGPKVLSLYKKLP
jgi:hypothetical protein